MKILDETEIKNLNNRDLFKYCQDIGRNARQWKNRFVALLPEVKKRKLYKNKKFHSIYEFAAKLGGVSNNVVDDVLRLNEKFKEMPKLKAMISKVGVSKLKIVAGVAKIETDSFLADKVSSMTRACLETYVRDIKKNNSGNFSEKVTKIQKIFPGESEGGNANFSLFEEQNGTSENQNLMTRNKDKSTFSMPLSEEAILNLRLIKQKLEKEKGEVLCWDKVVNLMAEKLLTEESKREYKTRESKSRPIPAKKRRDQSKKCIVPGCNKPTEVIHHPERWALTKSHDNIKAMCKAHHELAHRGHLDEQNDFRTIFKPIIDPIKAVIDQKVLAYLKAPFRL